MCCDVQTQMDVTVATESIEILGCILNHRIVV